MWLKCLANARILVAQIWKWYIKVDLARWFHSFIEQIQYILWLRFIPAGSLSPCLWIFEIFYLKNSFPLSPPTLWANSFSFNFLKFHLLWRLSWALVIGRFWIFFSSFNYLIPWQAASKLREQFAKLIQLRWYSLFAFRFAWDFFRTHSRAIIEALRPGFTD